MTVRDHLQNQHGLDITAEWYYAPDDYRRNVLDDESLEIRHTDLHEMDAWNEASDPHDHDNLRWCEDCGRRLPDDFTGLDRFCNAACEDHWYGSRDDDNDDERDEQ